MAEPQVRKSLSESRGVQLSKIEMISAGEVR